MSTELYPLTLEPAIGEQIWGRFSEPPPADESLPPGFSLGTLWLATDNSRVAAGPQAGRSLGHLRQLWGSKLVGSNAGGDPDRPLPVELKLKRTGEAAIAVGLNDDSLWYFLSADEDSTINTGYRRGLNFQTAASSAGRDPGRWSEFMPEYPVETGQCLYLPPMAPLLLGAGLTVAQIGPPTGSLSHWPLPGLDKQSLRLAAGSETPSWLKPKEVGPGRLEIFNDETLMVTLISAGHLTSTISPEAATFIWPLGGQGRIRSRGPAPVTRLQPGRVIMMPAALGHYAVESGASVSYLLVEAF